MTTHDVVIAGAGPTGLMLAAELALGGADVVMVERRESQALAGTRAGGFHARTIEILDQRGVAERFLAEGKPMQIASIGQVPLDISDFPTRHNYGLALGQNEIERILAEWVAELGVTIRRGTDVSDFSQDDDGVDVVIPGAASLRARYLVGCDGGRSKIRKRANIDFVGCDASVSYLIAECSTTEDPNVGLRQDAKGTYAIGRTGDGNRARIVLREEEVRRGDEPTEPELRELLVTLYGTDFGVHDITWLSRFSDMTRQAASYRERRVLLAGDAAHVHSPMGGQGLNLGVQDAVNLGWKLAQVAKGTSPDSLLDSYQAERHPVGARALRLTMALTALSRVDDRVSALREITADVFAMEGPRKHLAGLFSGLDIQYDFGPGHPLLGRRMPDVDLVDAGTTKRAFASLHRARPVLFNFGETGVFDALGAKASLAVVNAHYAGSWDLPVIGRVAAPTAVLVRPDGYVAWVGIHPDDALRETLTKWFGTAVTR